MRNCRSLQQPQFTLGYDFQGYHFCLKGKTKIRPTQRLSFPVSSLYFLSFPRFFFFFFFLKRAGTNSYVQLLHLYSLTISDGNFTVRCIFSLRTDLKQESPVTLLETTVYEKIYVFINPVKYYIFHSFFNQYKHSVHLTIIMQRVQSGVKFRNNMFKCDVIMLLH